MESADRGDRVINRSGGVVARQNPHIFLQHRRINLIDPIDFFLC